MTITGKGIIHNINQDIVGKIILLDNCDDTYLLKCNNSTNLEILVSSNIDANSKFTEYKNVLILSSNEFANLNNKDILRISANGKYEVLYSSSSNDNSLFITERCNSKCVFCPQPPVNNSDFKYFFSINNSIIDNLDETTEHIGITGGEPLLAKEYLFKILDKINNNLPNTEVQLLTNGKLLGNRTYFSEIENYITNNYLFCIPLYSDFENDHDDIVGCKGAFISTIKGLYNLASINARVEIRIVLNNISLSRLRQMVEFIFKNLPFVEHVAFMGLEVIGLANKNLNKIWDVENNYQSILKESVLYLSNWGVNCSIYNIPLCCLPDELREFSVKSISDWKQSYSDECMFCSVKEDCGGVFSTSKKSIYSLKSIIY